MKKTLLMILGLTVAVQFLIPASMILKHERILRDGTLCRFKTRPIDPADPFQGRYVRLWFKNDYISATTGTNTVTPKWNERVYITLGTNTLGFCELKNWSRTRPEHNNYLKLKFTSHITWPTNAVPKLKFDLPFDRFYMDENKAPRAEKIVRSINLNRTEKDSDRATNCWANVRVLNGVALIEDVLIDGTSIRDLSNQPMK